MIGPQAACLKPLLGLPAAVLAQQLQQGRRALESELAFALALPENEATAGPGGALVGVAGAVRRARALPAHMAFTRAAWPARGKVPVLPAFWLARAPVPLPAARSRVIAAVLPFGSLNLEPRPDHAGLQVNI